MFGVLVVAGDRSKASLTTTIGFVEAGSPADEAGLRVGRRTRRGRRRAGRRVGRPAARASWAAAARRSRSPCVRDGVEENLDVTVDTIDNPEFDPSVAGSAEQIGRAGVGASMSRPRRSVPAKRSGSHGAAPGLELGRAIARRARRHVLACRGSEQLRAISYEGDENADETKRFLSPVGSGRLAVARDRRRLGVRVRAADLDQRLRRVVQPVPAAAVRRRTHRDRDLREDRVDDHAAGRCRSTWPSCFRSWRS